MSPESTARAAGQVFGLVLLTAGILKCWSISKRPTTSTKCVLSLLLVLSAWWLTSAGMLWLVPSPALRPLFGVVALLAFGLITAAIIVSVLGLVDYEKEPGKYVQGRAQAIWALVLCGFMVMLVVGRGIFTVLGASGLARQSNPGVPLVFQNLNFKITTPGRPWVQADASRINADAQVAFVRAQPEMYFMVMAEKTGRSAMSAESLAEMAGARMRSLADSVVVKERAEDSIGQLRGLKVKTEVELSGKSICYVQWFCATNGWAYQLMAWGRVQDANLLATEASRLKASFSLLDPQRLSPLAGRHAPSDFASTNFQFAVHCSDPGWLIWDDVEEECPYCTFGVLHQQGVGLAVAAVNLLGLEPEPQMIYRGFLTLLGQRATADPLAAARSVQAGYLRGAELDFAGSSGSAKQYSYRARMLYTTNVAYLVAAWVETRRADRQKLLADAIARVAFLGPAENLPTLDQMTAREKRVHRMAFNAFGTAYYEGHRFDQSLSLFKQAIALDTFEHETPYLKNFVDTCLRAGKFHDALDELRQHQVFVDKDPALRADQAFVQGRLGQTQLAITNYSKLFASGYTSEEHFREYMGLLAGSDQSERALKELEAYVGKQDTPPVRLMQAELLKRQKRFAEAVELLKAQRQKNPFHAGIIYSLGDAFIASGQPSEALALSQQVLKEQGPSAGLWVLQGRAQFALKWYKEAKDAFEKASKEAPDDAEIKNWLTMASGVLGQGANSMVKDPIEPVPLPAQLSHEPSPPSPAYGKDEGAYYSRRITGVAFARGKEMRSTEYVSVHVLSPEGVSDFSTFQIRFHPLNEELYVNKLEVRDASGAFVSSGALNDYYVLDERSSEMATGRKVLNIPISGLQPGFQIEAVFTRREFGTAKEFTFLPISFSRAFPLQESITFFLGDTNQVRWVSDPSLAPEAVEGGICWRWKDPPMAKWEPLLPEVSDYAPMLWLSDATMRWPELVADYLDSIAPRLEEPPELADLSRRITQGATNLEQKLSAVAGYIQTNYTYKAIEFGRRSRLPQSLGEIVRNKYGDCKDHAVLARQLLQSAGVPASLALVNFNGAVREDLPSLDQFDHMIVRVPDESRDWFLDCTSKSSDLRAGWTLGLAGHSALILDKDAPRFIRIPQYPTNASVVQVARDIQFTNQTEALVNERLLFAGVHAAFLRSFLRGQSATARRAYVANELVCASGELLDVTIGALEDAQAPLTLRISSIIRGQFQVLGNQIVGTPPLGIERTFLGAQPIEKRTAPFEVAAPLLMERQLTITLPAEFKPKLELLPARTSETEFVKCRTSVEAIAAGWRLSSSLYEPSGRRPAQEYSPYCAALRQAVETLKPSLVGEKIQP